MCSLDLQSCDICGNYHLHEDIEICEVCGSSVCENCRDDHDGIVCDNCTSF